MQNTPFKAISLSYKTAPLEVRELFALDNTQIRTLLVEARETLHITELFVLSTCNRTEVYYSSPQNLGAALALKILKIKGVQEAEILAQKFFPLFLQFDEPLAAARQLFRVALGLESQVVGDLQITNQVKTAYQHAADTEMSGPFLHRLLHTIFFTNKRVVQETAFRSGAASTSYATVELIETLTADISQPKVLVLGLGEIGHDVLANLQDSPIPYHITIANRTLAKAQTLANQFATAYVAFERVWEAIAEADVVICSIAKDDPFITVAQLQTLTTLKYKYLVDLAVPRSIEPEVETLPNVVVYNIDNINNKANEALQRRLAAIPQVEQILAETLAEFSEWAREMEVSPTIQKLKNALENIRTEEIDRYTKELSQEEWAKVDKITKSIMQKIIKLPVLQLKAACKRGEAETLIDVLNDLFNLEKEQAPIKK